MTEGEPSGRQEELVSMTYAALAQRLGIKLASAKRLVQRRGWQRVRGNDKGAVRVMVPVTELPPSAPTAAPSAPPDSPFPSPPTVTPDNTTARLQGLVEGLEAALRAEVGRREAAEARLDDLMRDRDAWRSASEQWREQAQRSIWSRLFGR